MLYRISVLLLFLSVMGCATQPVYGVKSCEKRSHPNSVNPPCWFFDTPDHGIVIRQNKKLASIDQLLGDALMKANHQFAITRFGEEISIDGRVTSETIDINSNYSVSYQLTRNTVHQSGNDNVIIRSKIVDYYYDFAKDVIYTWVEEIPPE